MQLSLVQLLSALTRLISNQFLPQFYWRGRSSSTLKPRQFSNISQFLSLRPSRPRSPASGFCQGLTLSPRCSPDLLHHLRWQTDSRADEGVWKQLFWNWASVEGQKVSSLMRLSLLHHSCFESSNTPCCRRQHVENLTFFSLPQFNKTLSTLKTNSLKSSNNTRTIKMEQ